MSENQSQPLPILITPKSFERIMQYAQMCPVEISGFAAMNLNTQIIDRVYPLLEQQCSGGETELDHQMIHRFIESGQSSRANVWWHSHANFGCFWSGTDKECIEQFAGTSLGWLVSIVVNKKREYKARIDIFKPVRIEQEIRLIFHYEYPLEEIERIRAEVKEKVCTKKPDKKDKVIGALSESERAKFVKDYHQREFEKVREDELHSYGFKTTIIEGKMSIVEMNDAEKREYMSKQLEKEKENHGTGADLFGFGDGNNISILE